MEAAILYAILAELMFDLRERLETVLRAVYILNPEEYDSDSDSDDEDEPPKGMYT